MRVLIRWEQEGHKLVVTIFFPRSLGLVQLIVSLYPRAIVPPSDRRASDAYGYYLQQWLGGYLSLGSLRQRYRAQLRHPVSTTIAPWPSVHAHPRFAVMCACGL